MFFKYLITSIFIFSGLSAHAQSTINCEEVLDTEPFFVQHKSSGQDDRLKKDMEILRHCGNFEAIDTVFFKGPMLGALMLDQVRTGKPATYRTLIDYFQAYKKTPAYAEFVKGLTLYQELAEKKIDLKNWEVDKELFVRMGFTVGDLEDFKLFLSGQTVENLTYKAALTRYMSEIEAMRVDK